MKIAVISDIHGNSSALKELFSSLSKFEHIVFCGDIVGYYYNVSEVLADLQKLDVKLIKGNHDQMLLDVLDKKVDLELITQRYGHGISIAIQNMTSEQVSYLRQLPEQIKIKINGKKICISHGSPLDANEYVYPDSFSAHEQIAALTDDIFILGHTHYPMNISMGNKLIVNPGSVGQSRDYDSRASWGELDLQTMQFVIHRVSYNQTELLKQIEKYDSDLPFLREVLLR